ncbi:MBL fold metallo-hydrolase [Candidatus Hodarchaeum mangrovi]
MKTNFTIRTFSVIHGKVTIHIFKKFFTISPPKCSSLGFIFSIQKKLLINLGDTIFLAEWKLDPPFKNPDILIIPVGGQMTMGPQNRVDFVELAHPKMVIPCHYNWDILFYKKRTDISNLRKLCEKKDILFKAMSPCEQWVV